MIKFKKIAFLAMTTLALAACGGGDGGDAAPEIDAALHIKGTVDGVVYNGTDAYREVYESLPDLFGDVTAPDALAGSRWNIYQIPEAAGTYQCNRDNGPYIDLYVAATDSSLVTGKTGGSCTIKVVKASAEEFVGTFKATLVDENNGNLVTLTNGSFRLGRADER